MVTNFEVYYIRFKILRLMHVNAAVFLPLWTPGIRSFGSLVATVKRYLLIKLKFVNFSFSDQFRTNFIFMSSYEQFKDYFQYSVL